MLVVHGTYYLARQRTAYRNDYCLSCGAVRLAFEDRTFDVLHVFWIPILPLGLWRRWHCSVCGQDPHARTRSSRGMLWVGVVCLVLFTLAFWAGPIRDPKDTILVWCFRIGGPIATVAAVRSLRKRPPDVDLREILKRVEPIMSAVCVACQVQLVPREPRWRCPRCGMERASLHAA